MAHGSRAWPLLLASGMLVATACTQTGNAMRPAVAQPATPESQVAPRERVLEPKAIEVLKAASARLAAARSMAFTAVVYYESPSAVGPALVYTTRSEVTLQRPDKLRVITPGDGPASQFYYDGKTMTAFEPAANLAAVAKAPPTIDAALKAAYDNAAIYFPFTDVIVADPYRDIAEGLTLAFYIGQSQVIGGVTTDMVAYANEDVFVQTWIGAEDRLPRLVRAVYRRDPAQLRHALELSGWKLDLALPAGFFEAKAAAKAARIAFSRPDAMLTPEGAPPVEGATPATE